MLIIPCNVNYSMSCSALQSMYYKSENKVYEAYMCVALLWATNLINIAIFYTNKWIKANIC